MLCIYLQITVNHASIFFQFKQVGEIFTIRQWLEFRYRNPNFCAWSLALFERIAMTVEAHRQLSSSASSCYSSVTLSLTSPFAPSIRVLQPELISLPSIRVPQHELVVFNVLRTTRTRCLQRTVSRTATARLQSRSSTYRVQQ